MLSNWLTVQDPFYKLVVILYGVTFLAYAGAAIVNIFRVRGVFSGIHAPTVYDAGDLFAKWAPFALLVVTFGATVSLMAHNWITLARPPFKSFYEMFIFLTATASLFFIGWELIFKTKTRSRAPLFLFSFLGVAATLGLVYFIMMSVARYDVEEHRLPPALQHWVFIPHVFMGALAYGAALIAAAAGMVYILTTVFRSHRKGERSRLGQMIDTLKQSGMKMDLEQIAFKTTIISALLIFAGPLLLGAWWGKIAWTDYWFWDPKETWALLIFLSQLVYIHLRWLVLVPGGRSRVTASGFPIGKVLSSAFTLICLATVLFTLMGMHLLPSADTSEHIYTE